MYEGTYAPPFYLDLYNFKDGAQDDIFLDSYTYIPTPSETQREVPTPINHSVPQPSPVTGAVYHNSVVRTVGESGVLDNLAKALLSIVGLYVGLFWSP